MSSHTPAGDDLVHLNATDALQLFAGRALSPVELMRAVIERVEKVEPHINAFTERLCDEALEQARHAEARYLGEDGLAPPRPLEGIPVAAKEKHAIVGRTLTEGSLAHEGRIATENAPVIDRILGAGGIIHARTTTPEFSLSTYTHSRMWGITRNPWNPDFTPGGSSGGAGASLAAGTTLLASACDIGGSTRIPAADLPHHRRPRLARGRRPRERQGRGARRGSGRHPVERRDHALQHPQPLSRAQRSLRNVGLGSPHRPPDPRPPLRRPRRLPHRQGTGDPRPWSYAQIEDGMP
ncbi:amidase [Streptomyces sp. NPDC005899]|uniref:amidase n=1 Tax=Streptomyces sp. NPDC005899 TaxID=3155716 RepID=UPI0033FD318A